MWPTAHVHPHYSLSPRQCIGCPPQTNRKALLLKSESHYTQRRWADTELDVSLLLTNIHGTEREILFTLSEEKGNHQPNYKLCNLQPDCKTSWAVMVQPVMVVRETNHSAIEFTVLSMSWNSFLTLQEWPESWYWISHGPRGKPNTTVLKLKKHSKKKKNDSWQHCAILIDQIFAQPSPEKLILEVDGN